MLISIVGGGVSLLAMPGIALNEGNVIRVISQFYRTPNLKVSPETDEEIVAAKPSPKRFGGNTTYNIDRGSPTDIHKLQSIRAYRVLSYKEGFKGKMYLMDILDGKVYSDTGHKITHDAIVYSNKRDALSERFPPNHACKTKLASRPRVLVAFDCWGYCLPRRGGAVCYQIEFAKYMGIVQCLDAPSPHSRNRCKIPVEPFCFPESCHVPPPRQVNCRDVRVNRKLP